MNEREALRQLSHDELVEMVVELQMRVKALEEKDRRPTKTPNNSSLPSGQSHKRNKRGGTGAKRGPKVGHAGHSRTKAEAEIVVDVRVERCAGCGADLRGVEQQLVGSRQVVELPAVRPVVMEARRYGGCCPNCGRVETAEYPAGFEETRTFGPRLEAVIHYLHVAHPLSYVRVQALARDLFGLDISLGGLVNVVRRCGTTFEAAASAILDDIRTRGVIGSDETGMRLDGTNAWLWVVQTADSAYYTLAPTRGAVVLDRLMGDSLPTVWVSDLAKAQLAQAAVLRQICLAHQVRDLQYAIDSSRCAWAYRFQDLLYRAMRLGERRDTIPPEHYGLQALAIERACDALLNQWPASADSLLLHRRFVKHRQHLFTFLYVPDVPPTNNASEQALRNSVIYRKVTGGFRSDWGAAAYANVVSVLETARRRGQNLLDTLLGLLTPPVDLSVLFAPLRE